MSMRNIALRLRYDGSRYHGWQVQKNEISVAQTLEEALSKVCKHPVKAVGCGRTDAGVHALRYCANFRTGLRNTHGAHPLAVNARLPGDIAVEMAVEVPERFNAIGSCIKKEYIYKILNSAIRDPFLEKACMLLSPAAGHGARRRRPGLRGKTRFQGRPQRGHRDKNHRAYRVLVQSGKAGGADYNLRLC